VKFADLHLHTLFSDGTYTPEELVLKAVDAGLACIAITDHDTVCGLAQAIAIGRDKGLEVLPGIELSAEYGSQEVHVLGYLINYKLRGFLRQLDILRENRVMRVHKIIGKLNAVGINLDTQAVFDICAGGIPGRLHIARALVKGGFVKSIFEAFNKYIGDKGPAYVLGFHFSPQDAIRFIRDAGGVSVLAHPHCLHNDELILKFAKLGLMGLEAYYPEYSQEETNFYLNLAKEYNLLVTGGSDCHGNAKSEVKIGSVKIPYELVEKLKEANDPASSAYSAIRKAQGLKQMNPAPSKSSNRIKRRCGVNKKEGAG